MTSGTESTLRTYKTLVTVVWIGLTLVFVYLAVGVPVGLMNPRLVLPWLGVGFWGPGLVIGVPWESLAPAQWRSYLLSAGLPAIVGTGAVLYAVDQVRRILREAGADSPFTPANAHRIKKAGIALLFSAGVKAVRDICFSNFVAANVTVPGVKVAYRSDLGLSTAFLGIMILAVAEVMRHGVKLQEDQDLTV